MERILDTKLSITILDELGQPVNQAQILVFDNLLDYQASKNPLFGTPVFSNENGKAWIHGLEEKSYFIHVEKDGKSNQMLAVETGNLIKGKINKITIIIE